MVNPHSCTYVPSATRSLLVHVISSKSVNTGSTNIHHMITRSKQHSIGASFQALRSSAKISALAPIVEPSSIYQAMQYPLWKSTIQAEL